MLVSSAPNFRPDTGGRRWSLIPVASSVALRGGAGAAFPSTRLYMERLPAPAALCGAAPGCTIWSAPCLARAVPALGRSTKARTQLRLRLESSPSERLGSREFNWRSLPGAARLLPSASPAPVPTSDGWVPAPCVSPRPSRRMSTSQNFRRSLIRVWRPVCSSVGAAVLGAEPAPFPSPLPPVSGGAGPVRSLRALLWTCSVPLFCERGSKTSPRLASASLPSRDGFPSLAPLSLFLSFIFCHFEDI